MAKDWFGKGCMYLIAQWERDDSEENLPVLVYCSHKGNRMDSEGNCCKSMCPNKGAFIRV